MRGVWGLPPYFLFLPMFGRLFGRFKPPLPGKIRCFLLRVVNYALPIMEDLYRRRCSPNPLCPIYNVAEESVEHFLFLCLWVEAIWFGRFLSYRVNRVDISTFAQWLSSLSSPTLGSKDEANWYLSYAGFTCWHIWKARCSFIYNQTALNPH